MAVKPIKTVRSLAQFALWTLQSSAWSGCDLEGYEIQQKALKLGIVKEVPYDPSVHGDAEFDTEPGDAWYVWSDDVANLLKDTKQ